MGRLLAEYLAALRTMPLEKARELAACGVPWTAIAAACPVPMRITINRAGDRYRPDEAGQPGWVMPVAAVDPGRSELIETGDPLAVITTGPFIDLAGAYLAAAPGPWALRRGHAMVLGAIPPQYFEPEPVRVHRDVAAWLRAGCRGIVLLTRNRAAVGRILSQIERVDFEDAGPAFGTSTLAATRSGRPLNRRRLEGVIRKIKGAGEAQREGTLRWAARVLGPAARSDEIRPDIAQAMLVRAAAAVGIDQSVARRLIAAGFHTIGGLNEGERRRP